MKNGKREDILIISSRTLKGKAERERESHYPIIINLSFLFSRRYRYSSRFIFVLNEMLNLNDNNGFCFISLAGMKRVSLGEYKK